MGNNNQSANLPTEFINEKSILTLSGATFVVLLVCYVINFIFGDTFNYKVYRGLGFVISLTVAVIIAFLDQEKKPAKWFFAFINGCLIFSSASGVNVMSSSYLNMPSDSGNAKQASDFILQNSKHEEYSLAGIISLPGMVNWWPDERLIAQNTQYSRQIRQLESDIIRIQQQNRQRMGGDHISPSAFSRDSVQILKNQLSAKEDQIIRLRNALENNNRNDIANQLTRCLEEQNRLVERLREYTQRYEECQQYSNSLLSTNNELRNQNDGLSGKNNQLTRELRECRRELRERQTGVNQNTHQLNAKVDSLTRINTELLRQLRIRNRK